MRRKVSLWPSRGWLASGDANGISFSDNAQYFKRAEKELKETLHKNNIILNDFADQYRLEWHYSTENHSEGGGVWERMVKAYKTPLRKVLQEESLTYVELLTISKDIEAMINDRPLIGVSDDTYEVITPSMLCLGRRIKTWVDFFSETELDQTSDIHTPLGNQRKAHGHVQRPLVKTIPSPASRKAQMALPPA